MLQALKREWENVLATAVNEEKKREKEREEGGKVLQKLLRHTEEKREGEKKEYLILNWSYRLPLFCQRSKLNPLLLLFFF